jgi:hypothetical protein
MLHFLLLRCNLFQRLQHLVLVGNKIATKEPAMYKAHTLQFCEKLVTLDHEVVTATMRAQAKAYIDELAERQKQEGF